MPVLDGYGVLTTLRAEGQLPELPVLMVSAADEMAGVIRCIELGAQDYLTKPINAPLLEARVRATLERKQLRDLMAAQLERTRATCWPPAVCSCRWCRPTNRNRARMARCAWRPGSSRRGKSAAT